MSSAPPTPVTGSTPPPTCCHTTKGDIWVTTTTDAGSRISQLAVTNTGPALSRADLASIFEPFRRLIDRTSHEGVGPDLAFPSPSHHPGQESPPPDAW
jgi:hypothetical protein